MELLVRSHPGLNCNGSVSCVQRRAFRKHIASHAAQVQQVSQRKIYSAPASGWNQLRNKSYAKQDKNL